MPPQIFQISSHLVLERRYLKQNTVASLKSNILPPQKFLSGYATEWCVVFLNYKGVANSHPVTFTIGTKILTKLFLCYSF